MRILLVERNLELRFDFNSDLGFGPNSDLRFVRLQLLRSSDSCTCNSGGKRFGRLHHAAFELGFSSQIGLGRQVRRKRRDGGTELEEAIGEE